MMRKDDRSEIPETEGKNSWKKLNYGQHVLQKSKKSSSTIKYKNNIMIVIRKEEENHFNDRCMKRKSKGILFIFFFHMIHVIIKKRCDKYFVMSYVLRVWHYLALFQDRLWHLLAVWQTCSLQLAPSEKEEKSRIKR